MYCSIIKHLVCWIFIGQCCLLSWKRPFFGLRNRHKRSKIVRTRVHNHFSHLWSIEAKTFLRWSQLSETNQCSRYSKTDQLSFRSIITASWWLLIGKFYLVAYINPHFTHVHLFRSGEGYTIFSNSTKQGTAHKWDANSKPLIVREKIAYKGVCNLSF